MNNDIARVVISAEVIPRWSTYKCTLMINYNWLKSVRFARNICVRKIVVQTHTVLCFNLQESTNIIKNLISKERKLSWYIIDWSLLINSEIKFKQKS